MRVESRIRYQGYSSMPEYPKGVSSDEEKNMQESETKALFSVIGMTCSACAGSVEKAIKRLPGIKEVAVDVLKDRTQVIFSPSSVNEETIRQTIEDIGFKATLIEETANEKCIWVCRIRIVGMACTSCSGAVESVLKLVPGVQRAQVALATGEAEVKCDPKLLSCKELLQAIDDIGFEAIIVGTGESRNKIQLKVDGLCNENNVQMIVSSLEGQPGIQDIQVEAELHKVSISYLADVTGPRNFIRVIESTGSGQFKATIFPERGGRGTHKQEEIIQYYNSLLWSLVFSIPVFLTSMIFMYIPSTDFFETSSMLISFILLGKYLEGDAVIGGTFNENGVLHIMATKVGSESALSQIVRLVESAQMAKAPVQKFADRISKFFVPLVVFLSFSTWLAWFLAGKLNAYPKSLIPSSMDSFQLALQFGISVMVIACPCALGLATPTAVMVGTGVGASQGVLIKGGQALESAHKVECIVFDKTGTLTIGKPMVVETRLLKSMALRQFYEMVAAVEVNSEHPLAKAIVEYAKKFREEEESNVWPEVKQFESITGQGVMAVVRNREVIVGNKRLMLKKNVAIPVSAENFLEETEGFAQTGILVSIDHELVGVVAISDPVKPAAQEVISILTSMQIKSILVTGDNWGTAHAVAKEVGIGTVIAEAKPEVKAEKVKDLQALNFVVAMVGDGINDSPALVAADIGMAIGAGTDIAIEAADIVLMKSNLEDVITAIDLSRYTFRRICLNYIWALAYNLIAIPVAAGALFPSTGICLPPWVAGAAMAASSLTVVCCSLLLKNYRRPKKLDALELQGLTVE
ncbi:unnamed protein product [Coffea canephora]|uniref:P-type Cu(+) transporter n=1 Tax=Coffea canephora TaxID=49390 RepID=A0A068UN93_COFCA|nr:unnamed protein product [Coffea canephora]